MQREVRIPRGFYDDHLDRDLDAPPVLKTTSRGYVIDADHPDMAELRNDAEHYAGNGNDAPLWLKSAAAALLRALP